MENKTNTTIRVLLKVVCIFTFVLLCIEFGAVEKVNANLEAKKILDLVIPIGAGVIALKIVFEILNKLLHHTSNYKLWGLVGTAFLFAGLTIHRHLILVAVAFWVVSGIVKHSEVNVHE